MTRTVTMPETVRWLPSPGFSGSTLCPEGTAACLGGDELVAVLAYRGSVSSPELTLMSSSSQR
jgi:hypothetical protein